MDDSEPTPLHLPQNLPYPLKITSLNAAQNATVDRKSRLLEYSFVYSPPGPEQLPETRFGTWDSTLDGVVKAWNLKVGDVVTRKKAAESPAIFVVEPCKHEIQISGLCALCAKDMTIADYLDVSDTSRANIQMTHSAHGPTVSLEYAKRLERESADHLLKSRKLSLIVDLDQTIVHATVDPTVGEWINEGLAWEARQAKKASTTPPDDGAPTANDADDDDECNPNWEALKDVKSFRLGPESFGPLAVRSAHRGKGKNKMVETEGCMYYIKPRPGWKEFLRETATKYEMHVYTMGTRAYAEEVCAAIDPDGNIFGGRLLSRDESGNDFFVGIGDINSSFLPKIEPLTPVLNVPQATPTASINGSSTSPIPNNNANPVTPDVPTTVAADGEISELENAMFTQNNAALDAQLEERPLAKKEKELQEHEIQEQQAAEKTPTPPETPASVEKLPTPTPSPKPEKMHKKALLKNDDYELERIGKLLNEVHTRFFTAYDTRRANENAKAKAAAAKAYDVTRIIPRIRSEVFEGVHILFSSVIPLDTKPETTEIWRMAHMFGAQCSTELTSNITHVVAAKRGTVKVDMARRRGGIKIVWLAWFTDSIALWRRQDEKPYLLDDPPVVIPASSPTTEYHQLSSDLDIDSDDWDQEPPEMKETGPLHLEAINWDDINDEVEAAMNESDDEYDEYYAAFKSGNVSEDDTTDGGANNTSQTMTTRKRFRSATPSDGGGGNDEYLGTGSRKRMRSKTPSDAGSDYGSPLARRKKAAAGRTGYSKLKEGITADDIEGGDAVTNDVNESGNGTALPDAQGSSPAAYDEEEDGEDDDEEEEEEEDDFLARELEEEWG
ncbi:RNA polymerase II subunit A C-terminal domain phosphatase [Psilocybe cubensis]|uniref:protein-serine/threonine phosphatase n=2 Tax=Psilocybe cubensis TaxID=181762 RepID=A0A8H7Y591_PSICU|nr:RNA polymerase II subunit A C-terminal domain phosphatase [Psilocybe cubensis]KAH9486412.1 RNA polymerase II subunit A C-terminal domain phosphatase [Psilocybe cubensis]